MANENTDEMEVADQVEKDPTVGPAAGTSAAVPAGAAAGRKPKYPCLRCRKAVTKNSKSIKCNVCDQWVHVECEQISADMYRMICDPEKFGVTGFLWNCQSCMASAIRLEKLVRNMEGSLQEVNDKVTGAVSAIKEMDVRVHKLETGAKNIEKDAIKAAKAEAENVLTEMEEREARKANIIMHMVGECENERATGQERLEWDKQSCVNIFHELKLDMEMEDVKFCRRIGEKGDNPRPLLVGLYSEAERNKIIRRAHKLEGTFFDRVRICPDLTKNQRERENNKYEEAERRNANLSETDKQKNLQWAVVGGRGERRLIKTAARASQPIRRGGPHQARGSQQAPRGGQVVRGVYRPGRGGTAAATPRTPASPQAAPATGYGLATQNGRRRGRSPGEEVMEEDGQPPEKRQQDSQGRH